MGNPMMPIPLMPTLARIHLPLPTHYPKIHNLMMVAMWASLMLTQNLPSLLLEELPHRRRLTAVLLLHLHLMKPMASRTKGSRMSEDNSRLAVINHITTEAIDHLITALEATAALATLEAHLTPRNSPVRHAVTVCALQPYQWTFGSTTLLRGSRHLCSPVGKFASQKSRKLEGLFEKSFCITNCLTAVV